MSGDLQPRTPCLAQNGEVRLGRLCRPNLHEIHVELHERVDRLSRVGRIGDAKAIRQDALPDARIAHAPRPHIREVARRFENGTRRQDARANIRPARILACLARVLSM